MRFSFKPGRSNKAHPLDDAASPPSTPIPSGREPRRAATVAGKRTGGAGADRRSIAVIAENDQRNAPFDVYAEGSTGLDRSHTVLHRGEEYWPPSTAARPASAEWRPSLQRLDNDQPSAATTAYSDEIEPDSAFSLAGREQSSVSGLPRIDALQVEGSFSEPQATATPQNRNVAPHFGPFPRTADSLQDRPYQPYQHLHHEHSPSLSTNSRTSSYDASAVEFASTPTQEYPTPVSPYGSILPASAPPLVAAQPPLSPGGYPLPLPTNIFAPASQYDSSLAVATDTPMSTTNNPGNVGVSGTGNPNNSGLGGTKAAWQQSSVAASAGPANRNSMHNGLSARDATSLTAHGSGQANAASTTNVATKNSSAADAGRGTPQPVQSGEDMSLDEINQLIKDHKELREKYTKVKKYYFEKEDQVKQLQNSLAHQRLSQSRTSLDDSEYSTRFNRLDGLVAQLAFGIRKNWRSVPSWLGSWVNKDAVATGKQEMTVVGRAVISCWLVEEVFDKYFHPDLEPSLSMQLRAVQKNIRRFAPATHNSEEEELLTSKIVNWRLATLEGLQDALRSLQCPTYRAQLTDNLKDQLCNVLAIHLQDPPPPELEGGVHMIIELIIGIAIHLPLESREVAIEYFLPGDPIAQDHMKLESGIPPLASTVADEAAERASTRSGASDLADATNLSDATAADAGKKRSMLSAFTGGVSAGTIKSKSASVNPSRTSPQGKHGGSSSSLTRPDSAHGQKEQLAPRVRLAAGVGVHIRGRSVLFKAPVFATS